METTPTPQGSVLYKAYLPVFFFLSLLTSNLFAQSVPEPPQGNLSDNNLLLQGCELVLNCPPANGGTYNCIGDVPAADTELISVQESCGPVTITVNDDMSGSGCSDDPTIITRTYTVFDGVNTGTCTQVFMVADNTAPLLTCPPAITLSCNDSTLPAQTGMATATDECSGVMSLFAKDYLDFPPAESPEMRWVFLPEGSVAGNCESSTSCDNGTICFGLQYTPNLTGTLTSYTTGFFVDCLSGNNPVIYNNSCVMNDNSMEDADCGGSGLVLMNSSGNNGMIPIMQQMPVILHQVCFQMAPGQLVHMVEDEVTDLTTSIDLPDGSQVSEYPSFEAYDAIADQECTMSCPYATDIYRQFVAIDACGNAGICVQHIHIDDSTGPIVTCPPDVTVECNGSTSPDQTGTATATDECHSVASIVPKDYNDFPPAESPEMRWVYLEPGAETGDCVSGTDCNNSIVCFGLQYTPGLTGTLTSYTTGFFVDCIGGNNPIITNMSCVMNDNSAENADCGGSGLVLMNSSGNNGALPVMEDMPVILHQVCFSMGPDQLAQMTEDTITDLTTSIDLPGGIQVSEYPSFGDFVADANQSCDPTCPFNKDIYRKWVAYDECGNAGYCVQHISVRDSEGPVLTCPLDMTLECSESTLPAQTGMATATDQCSSVSSIFSKDYDHFPPGLGSEMRWVYLSEGTIAGDCVSGTDCSNNIVCFGLQYTPDLTGTLTSYTTGFFVDCIGGNDPIVTNMSCVMNDHSDEDPDCAGTGLILMNCSGNTGAIPVMQQMPLIIHQVCFQMGPGQLAHMTEDAITDLTTSIDLPDGSQVSEYPAFEDYEAEFNANCDMTCPYPQYIYRKFVAIDECGNAGSCVQEIKIQDTTPPVITCPSDATVNCNGDTTPAATGIASATDNCTAEVSVSFSDVTINGPCPQVFTIVRTWTATDDCGNASTCNQSLYINNGPVPAITCPPNLTVACANNVPPPNTSLVTASDNCGTQPVVSFIGDVTVNQTCINRYTLNRTYQATSMCGATATCVQTITVFDNVPPTITCPMNVTVSCIGQAPAININLVTATDNCSGTVTKTFVSDQISGTQCTNRLTITRTYRATDACGNSATCAQIITINDQTPPTITCPANISVTCASLVPAPSTAGITGSDNCGGTPTFTFVSDVTVNQTCVNRYTLNRTYRATDACGNSATCQQTITINDQTAPSISCPANITVSCAGLVPAPNPAAIGAGDNCTGGTTVTHVGDVITNQTCANRYLITRTYRATDACGNSATCAQLITVNDQTPPLITCPSDITVDCAMDIPAPDPSGVDVSDNCGSPPAVTFVGDITINPFCVNQFTVLRTYQAMDACGNSATCTQTITVNDQTPPVIICPADLTIECAEDVPAPDVNSVISMNNCSMPPVVVFVGDVTINQTCANRFTIVRTYGASDACGNSSTCAQVITVFDTTAPLITCPVDVTVQCATDVPAPDIAGVDASDNCNLPPVVTYLGDVTVNQTCANRYIINRTYQAADVCGNSSTCVQAITVYDDTAPGIICPADITLQCAFDVPTPNPALVVATDNCSGGLPVVAFVSDVTVNQTCLNRFTILRTYSATDVCGNSATCVQSITIDDETPPAISCPANITVSCAGEVPAPNIALVGAGDNCAGGTTVTHAGDVITNQTCANRYLITRTYRATDVCGNSATCAQLITVNDQTPPDIVCPDDITVECMSEVPASDPASVDASDNCNAPPAVTFVGDVTVNPFCINQFTVLRTYQAMDACGNSATCTQTITVHDQTPPSIMCPPNLTVQCASAVPAPDPSSVISMNNCSSNPTVLHLGDVTVNQSCVNRYVIIRTYGASDACGNSSTCAQTITVFDDMAPVITCPPNLTVQCAADVPLPSVASVDVSDNCGAPPTVTHLGDVTVNQTCTNRFILNRTYQAVDACGNSATCVQTITVFDNQPPVITCPSIIMAFQCSFQVPAPNPASIIATDNCTSNPTVVHVADVTVNQTCANRFMINRTYRATDECGNSATCNQIITVYDSWPPDIVCPPNITVQCAEFVPAPNPASVVWTDNCNATPVITHVSDITVNQVCANRFMINRTYRAVDNCGNSSTCTQVITVFDNALPVILCPADITVTCSEDIPQPEPGAVTVSDNCNGIPTVVFVGDITINQECAQQYSVSRTYQAVDACGNSATCVQTIVVRDNIPPDITCPPDLTVTCSADLPEPDVHQVEASDRCGGNVTVDYVDDLIDNPECTHRYNVNRIYVATDECGNTATCAQVITVYDDIAPIVTCPTDVTVSCADETDPDMTGMATATDNCEGTPEIGSSDEIITGSCPQQFVIVRTWQAVDDCGNTGTCIQLVTVHDQIAPVITCPEDLTVDLEESTMPDNTGMATATDNCDGEVTLDYQDITLEGLCDLDYVIFRTWTASDPCGNESTCEQKIIVTGGCFLDLALTKTLSMGQPMTIMPGDDVHFTITVNNFGNVPVGAITIVDYIPIGFSLNDPDWTAGTDGSTGQSASIDLSIANGGLAPGGLLPMGSVSVEITLATDPNLTGGSFENLAEISSVRDVDGNDIDDLDIDSQPDRDDTNDNPGEDDIDAAIICISTQPVIVGSHISCTGESTTYEVEHYNPENSYEWIVGDGGFITESTDSTITVYWYAPPFSEIMISLIETAGEECQFDTSIIVKIADGGPMACFDHVNLSLDNDCGTQVVASMILTGEHYDNDYYEIYVIDMNGDTLPNAVVTWEQVGQTFKVSVRQRCSGQSCWGMMTVEDKLPPIIDCRCGTGTNDERCRVSCLIAEDFLDGIVPEYLQPTVVDNCGGTTLEITNVDLQYSSCSIGQVIISWLATDAMGNTSTCEQSIAIYPLTLGDLTWPENVDADCAASTDPEDTGWPQLDGLNLSPFVFSCNVMTWYNDQTIPLCGGGRKIIRRWTVTNWCNSESINHIQILLLHDTTGPVLTCAPDMTVSTGVWNCSANVNLSKPAAVDACSGIISYQAFASAGTVVETGGQFMLMNLPAGTHTVTWKVRDECYNESSCTTHITVRDLVPPVVACQRHTIVSLDNDHPNGLTLVPAESFNDQSEDNCSAVSFRARRMDSCIDFNWTTNGACIDDTPGGNPAVDDHDRGTAFGPCIPVACCDLGQTIMVVLEVSDESGNVNTCMVEMEVQDKLAPVVSCPPDIRVSCGYLFDVEEGTFSDATGNNDGILDEDPLSEWFGTVLDAARHQPGERQHIVINDPPNTSMNQPHDWGMDGWAYDNCEVALSVTVSEIDDCSGASFPQGAPEGAVKLIERRFFANDGVQSGSCLQRIWVIDYDPFYITDTTCEDENQNDGVIWPCDVVISNCTDDLSMTGEPVIIEGNCSLVGMTHEDEQYDIVEGACFKILRTWKILDWCQYNPNTGAGQWTYVQTIKVADTAGPEVLDCPGESLTLCTGDPGVSLPANNQIFLGENNPDASSCSVHVNLHQTVREMCSSIVNYDVKFYPDNGLEFIQLKPLTVLALDQDHEGDMFFNTQTCGIPEIEENGLPYNDPDCESYHRLLWTVEDGCGNVTYCDYLFRLEDCKDPVPVCLNGISTVILSEEGEVTVWASDFNASSSDDCTPSEELLFSFSGSTYEPSFTYNCDNVPVFGEPFDEEIWVADGGSDLNCDGTIDWSERNKDFCVASIVIDDVSGICEEEGAELTGEIMTEQTEAVSQVMVHLESPGMTIPGYMTEEEGKYAFGHIPYGLDYAITASRNDDPLNGVSTLDLVFIQKHLLGLEPFTSPYQYIAADANNSSSISAIDLIEIRKLILGLYTEFPHNQSWRFVKEEAGGLNLPPWPLTEQINIHDLQSSSQSDHDFVGIKIGDVNHTAKAHLIQILPRSAKPNVTVNLRAESVVNKGQTVECHFSLPVWIQGFQWTLETEGLTFEGVKSAVIPIDEGNIGVLGNGVITMSWNGKPVDGWEGDDISFTLVFSAAGQGEITDMMRMSGQVTAAEAYSLDGETWNPVLEMNGAGSGPEFALYQNRPNPWNEQTMIEFDLPEEANADLTLYDVTGKVVKYISGHFREGHNAVLIQASEIPSPGLIYYRLDSGEYSATRKMMIIR